MELSGESVLLQEKAVAITNRSQSNCRPLLTDPGCLLEGIGDLQDTKIVPVAADDLDADRQTIRCEASRD